MDCQTLTELCRHFNDKLTSVTSGVELWAAADEPACQKGIVDLNKELDDLQHIVRMVKNEVAKQKNQLKGVEKMKVDFSSFLSHLEYTISNIPQRLPNTQNDRCSAVETSSGVHSQPSEPTARKPRADRPVCPVIEYVRVDEFEEVPKYMKGRNSYSRLNSMVDSLNKSLKAKYKILRMKNSALNDVNRKRFQDFKHQENKDTKGFFFVVESDLKEFAGVKMDASDRAMLTVLRHTHRIREIRTAGLTRHTVIQPPH